MHYADLIRVGELIKLAAQAAISFPAPARDDGVSKIAEIARRIEAAAEELIEVARGLEHEA